MSDDGRVTERRDGGHGGHGGGTLAPERVDELDALHDRPWVTIVWDDPVNLMTYVTYVFQTVFGYTREKAMTLMLEVHHQGRAAVSTGSRDEMERDVARLHAAGLWATVQQD
ncbi:MAG: ATP-dependent Clp protease adapter protein clpS [Frankiales bacterium]|nr:ATP-dependent Clp protease adapter protein clpS [Frankiales bacterium]